jgi:2-hydroxy-3-keto-5-methylthiopentenyl-1-phosphate phosphatase
MARVLCHDFDDTLVVNNVTREILERFAGPGWAELAAAYAREELTVEEYNARSMELVEAEPEEIVELARSIARPRAGLHELVGWAGWHEWQVAIVSNSIDIVVSAVLADLGLERLPRHAGRARKQYRWRVRYFSPRGIEIAARFKLSYVRAYQAAGDFVAFAGDGASDLEAGAVADIVFARSTLLERLSGTREHVYPFETFQDVIAILEQEPDRRPR